MFYRVPKKIYVIWDQNTEKVLWSGFGSYDDCLVALESIEGVYPSNGKGLRVERFIYDQQNNSSDLFGSGFTPSDCTDAQMNEEEYSAWLDIWWADGYEVE